MKRLHLLILSTWFLGNMGIHFVSPYLPQIATQLGSNVHVTQMLISSFLFGKAISMLWWGTISEYYGRRRFMLFGLVLFSFSCLVLGLNLNIYQMIFFRGMQGVGVGACLLMGRTMINDVSDNPTKSFAYLFTLAGLVIPLLPLLGGYMATHVGYQHAFLLTSLYPLLVFGVMYYWLPETNKALKKDRDSLISIFRDYQMVVKNPLFLSCLFISAFMLAGESSFNTAASFILIKNLGVSSGLFGLIKTVLGLCHLLGTFICALVVKRRNTPRLIGAGVLCFTVSSVLMTFGGSNETVLNLFIPMAIYYFGTGFVIATTLSATVKPFPNKKATALGFSLFLQFFISGMFSLITSGLGITTLKSLAGVLLITSLASTWIYFSKVRTSEALTAA